MHASPFFPPVANANKDGLLCFGGELTPERLVDAYSRGIFPWPIFDGRRHLLAWWSPDPREIIEFDDFHVSRRLKRRIGSGRFRTTCNTDFASVVAGCAAPRASGSMTWITPQIKSAYGRLHELGHAHSVECWLGDELAGGVYGVSLGGMFAAESMFHRVTDASKVALAFLFEHLRSRGFQLFDVQQATPHSHRLGAKSISRSAFLVRLRQALAVPTSFGQELAFTDPLFKQAPKQADGER